MRSEDHEELASWPGRSRSIRLRQGMPRARGGSCAWPRARGSTRSPPSNRGTRRWQHSRDGGASACRGRGAARQRDVRMPVPAGPTFGWCRPRLPVTGRPSRTAVRSPTCRSMTCAPIEVPTETRGGGEEPRTHVHIGRQRSMGAEGTHERFLAEGVRVRQVRDHTPEIATDLGVMPVNDLRERAAVRHREHTHGSSRCLPLASLVQEVPSTRRRRPREKSRRAGHAGARLTAVPERNGLFHSDTFLPNRWCPSQRQTEPRRGHGT
jgi:hypothetical protein